LGKVVEIAFQLRRQLTAHARDVARRQTRLRQRELHQLKRLVGIARESLKMARYRVAIGAEANVDRQFVNGAMKAARIIGAGAFIEHAGQQRCKTGLVGGVLRGAAANGEFQRDERHGVAFDKPGDNAAGRDDPLHMFGARGHGDDRSVRRHQSR